MGVKFTKRFSAFVIDAIIVMMITSVVTLVIPENTNVTKLNEELVSISEDYIEGKINKSAPLTYRIDKENFILSIVDVVITLLYFVVFAFVKGGQTLGKKLIGIKVEKQDGTLSINDMIFRTFIINGLLMSLVCLVLLFTTKDLSYLYSVSIVGFIQIILILVSCLMVLFRKDNLALQDIITKTKVVEVR